MNYIFEDMNKERSVTRAMFASGVTCAIRWRFACK